MNRADAKAKAGTSRVWTLAWLVPPMALGAVVRLWGLSGQVVIGDEIHLLHWAVRPAWGDVFSFHLADPCVPLAALLHVLLLAGVPLTEVICRLPAVVAGLVTLALLPLIAARVTGRVGAAALAWLVAISPSFIYYSRIARPYMIVVLLGAVAAVSFWRWWRRGGAGAAASYVVSGAAAVWFHPGMLPFVVAPLAFGAFELVWNRLRGGEPAGRSPWRLAGVALLLALAIVALLLPTGSSLTRVAEVKAAKAVPTLDVLGATLQLQSGSRAVPVVVIFWALAALGLTALWRRRPDLAGYGAILVAAQWLAMALVVRPEGVGKAVILNRYVLITLPVVFLWVVAGLGALRRLPGRVGWIAGPTAVVGLLGFLVATNPYPADPWLRVGPFAGSVSAIAFFRPSPHLAPDQMPPVYRALALQPGERAVVEVPAVPVSAGDSGAVAMARLYRRPVILGYDYSWLAKPGLALRTVCVRRPDVLRATGARFVVLVFDRPTLNRLAAGLDPPGRDLGGAPPRRRVTYPARKLDGILRSAWGPPHLVDGRAELWDLARLE